MKTPIDAPRSKVMVGLNIIGAWHHHIDMFITGQADLELRCALFHTREQRAPEYEEELQTPEVDADLERLKAQIKAYAVEAIKRGIEAEKRQLKSSVEKSFVGMNQQDPAGSVKELAAHYGVTISEYRKLKREGRLDELKKPVTE